MGVQAVLAWGHSARVRLKLVKLETKSCRCVLVCACMSRDESSIVEAAITGFGLDWYWSGAVLLPWVGCLIGNQYVSLNSLLLIIVLFFYHTIKSQRPLICSRVHLLVFSQRGEIQGEWPPNRDFTVHSLSKSITVSCSLFDVVSCLFLSTRLNWTPAMNTYFPQTISADKCDNFF